MPTKAPGSAVMMMNGSASSGSSRPSAGRPARRRRPGRAPAAGTPPSCSPPGRARRSCCPAPACFGILDNRVDLGGHGAEVAVLNVGVDVEDRLHVAVVRDHRVHAVLDVGQVAEQLRLAAAPRPRDRRVLQHWHRESIPYCGVCAATRYVIPIFGSSQKLGCTWPLDESDTKTVRDILLREPELRRAGPVHIEMAFGPFITW